MKPLDFGGEGATGSVNADGRLIALNFSHPVHGYVSVTSAPPFRENARYDRASVRLYRASLVQQEGFGIRPETPILERAAHLRETAIPEIELRSASGRLAVTTFARAQGVVQNVEAPPGTRWDGQLCLQRCAYTQLTEGGPLEMPPLRMISFQSDEFFVIHNPELGAAVAIGGVDMPDDAEQDTSQPLQLAGRLRGEMVTFGVGLTTEQAIANARWLINHASMDEEVARWRALLDGLPDDPLVRRGIVYTLEMCVPIGEGTCILTDHMLLPLSWNRDAYFAARALMSAGQRDLVRRHLIWTFETAERPNGAWGRSYLANGQVKDGAYQLDQQLYPLLELAEYLLASDDPATADRLTPHIDAALIALEARRDPNGLLPTDETPADDPIPLPYHLSSHILMWRTLDKLRKLGLAARWTATLPELRNAIQQAFITECAGREVYAYATDGAGHFHFYHDANDFPLALAPAWGFVTADDPVWRATIDFAFSDANRGGFYDGHLGSVHSPAPWALGDVQELIIARSMGDPARADKARAALRRAVQADSALPEAYHAADGSVFSRHWFVWTNAALACVELGAFDS